MTQRGWEDRADRKGRSEGNSALQARTSHGQTTDAPGTFFAKYLSAANVALQVSELIDNPSLF